MLSFKPSTKRSSIASDKLRLFFSSMLNLTPTAATETLVGIDFGNQRIHGVALGYFPATADQPASYQLQGMHSVAIPHGAIVDQQLQDIPQVVQALSQLRRQLQVRRRDVATAVTGSSVTTKILHVSNSLPVEMLALHVQQAAMAHLSAPLAEISLDFEILNVCENHTDCDQVLLSAARTEHVHVRVEALCQAGWRAQVVDIGSHALARAVCFLLAPPAAQSVAVLELGTDNLTFMVIVDGEIIYQRLQPMTADIPVTNKEQADIAASQCRNADYLEQLVNQVQRQLQLFCSNSGQIAPVTLMLCGAVSQLTQLAPHLSAALGIKVVLPDFSRVFGGQASLYRDAPAFSTALGLALREVCHV